MGSTQRKEKRTPYTHNHSKTAAAKNSKQSPKKEKKGGLILVHNICIGFYVKNMCRLLTKKNKQSACAAATKRYVPLAK